MLIILVRKQICLSLEREAGPLPAEVVSGQASLEIEVSNKKHINMQNNTTGSQQAYC